MSSAPMPPLRQQMIEDMSIRPFGNKTPRDYVRVAANFARFLGRSHDQAQPEDPRRHQLHLATDGATPGKMNAAPPPTAFGSWPATRTADPVQGPASEPPTLAEDGVGQEGRSSGRRPMGVCDGWSTFGN